VSLSRRRLVRVPASSANLGPGFDVMGAALGLHLELEVTETGSFAVQTDLDLPRDRSNLVVRAFERLHPADDFSFAITSAIPLCGGLGSSAAATLAGLMADADLLAHAGELEGHPDNAAAALAGGFVISDGARIRRLETPMGLEAVLVVPAEAVRTEQARAALPQHVPIADAARNVAWASLLTLGLATGDFEAIADGLHDALHQPYRAHLFPRSAALLARAPEFGALGATVSGAGPAILVWCRYEHTGTIIEAVSREAAGWATVRRVTFESQGADVREL